MAKFADTFALKIGEETVRGRRLTVREVRENWTKLQNGEIDVSTAVRLIADHVTLDDGSPIDPEELSQGQVREIVAELVLPKEGRGIADFIGLLC